MSRRFIIDTDTGSDDAWAIVEALCAEDIARVEAITTVCGNFPLDLCTKNALLAEDAAGGYLPPVYRGVEHPLLSQKSFAAYHVHGEDGLGGLNLPAPAREAEKKHAVPAIIDLVRENPGEIEIITIGPLTNIAVALTLAPDLVRKIKKLWILGGSAGIRGNLTECAEYNVGSDPEAAEIVLQSALRRCGSRSIRPAAAPRSLRTRWNVWLASPSPAGRFCALATRRLREFYNEIRGGSETYGVVDSLAVTAALYPEIMTKLVAAKCPHRAARRGKARIFPFRYGRAGGGSQRRALHRGGYRALQTAHVCPSRREITKIMPRFGFRKRGILGKEKIHERFYVL